MQVVQVDAIGGEPAQAALDRAHQVVARRTAVVGPLAHREVRLGRDHDLVALAAHQPAEHLLGAAVVVDVGAVEQVDPGVARGAPDRGRGRLVGVAAEHHRAERDARDLDARAAEQPHRWNAASMRVSTFSSVADSLPNPRMPPAAVAPSLANPTIWFLSRRFCSSLSCDASALMYASHAVNSSGPGWRLSQFCKSSSPSLPSSR